MAEQQYYVQTVDIESFHRFEVERETPYDTRVLFLLTIACKHQWIQLSEATVTRETNSGWIDYEFRINSSLLQEENTAQACFQEIISSAGTHVSPANLDFLKAEFASKTRFEALLSTVRGSQQCLGFSAIVRVVTGHLYYEQDSTRINETTFVEDSTGFAIFPASRSSIDALKTKKLGEFEMDEICLVCLDHFSEGEDVAEMPCAHVFHRRCIVSWLERNNTCPLCRFQLRSAIEDS